MAATIKAKIIKIGNSQGIRIPKLLLDRVNLNGSVEIEMQEDQLVIRPVRKAREGWAEQFKLMSERGDDVLLDDVLPTSTQWDINDWEW